MTVSPPPDTDSEAGPRQVLSPFLDFLAHATSRPIRLRTDLALQAVGDGIEGEVRRLRNSMPLVFCGGPAGWWGFGIPEAIPVETTTMTVTVDPGAGRVRGPGVDEALATPWPSTERLVVVYAGDARGAVLATRFGDLGADGADRWFAYWSLDGTAARVAAIWVGTFLAGGDMRAAVRWNAGINALGSREGNQIEAMLRERRIQQALNRGGPATGGPEVAEAPRLGDDLRAWR